MNYKFYIKKIDTTGSVYFMTEVEKKYSILEYFDFTKNSKGGIQELIDGVQKNRTLSEDEDPYVWGNEDVTVFSNKIGVLLIDKIVLRAGKEVTPLELTHDEFIKFLEDFKEFVAKNS